MKRKLLLTSLLVILILSTLGITAYAAEGDSISIGDPSVVGNYYFDASFTCDVTAETAENGYSCAIEFGVDPTLESTQGRMFNGTHNESGTDLVYNDTFSGFVPGQTIYYRAVMLPQGMPGFICTDDVIHTVTLAANLNDFTEVELFGEEDLSAQGDSRFYFTAEATGLYVVEIDGNLQSASVKLADGRIYGGARQSQYLFTVNLHAGETAYIFAKNVSGNPATLTINDSSALPSVVLGTQSLSNQSAYSFVAQESGEYSFTIDNEQFDLQYLDSNCNWVSAGSGFTRDMAEGEQICLFSSFNPQTGLNLTIEKVSQASTENSIEVVDTTHIAFDRVDFSLQISVTDETAESGYGYGFELSNDPSFAGGESVWRMTTCDWSEDGTHNEPHNNDQLTYQWTGGLLVPNVTYYVRGLLYDNSDDMNVIASGSNVYSFTMPDEENAYQQIFYGDTLSTGTANYVSFWKFIPDDSAFYGITTDNKITGVQIHGSNGKDVAEVYPNDWNNLTDMSLAFPTQAGETYYIYVQSAWSEGSIQDGTFTLTSGKNVIPALIENSQLEVKSGEVVQFTAPEDGYYTVSFVDGDFQSNLQYFDSDGNWKYANGQSFGKTFTEDETLFVKPNYYYYDGVALKSLIVEKKTAANENSIEVSAPTNVTNCSMDVTFTVSTTAELAEHGFSPAIEFGPDQDLQQNLSRKFANRYLEPMDQQTVTSTLAQFMPGQEFYYRAILIDASTNEIAATGSTVYHVQFLNNLDGFTPLELNVPYNLANTRQGKFYYTPDTDGMYSVQVNGTVNSVNVQQNNGMQFGVGGQLPSVLLGFYAREGENAFLTVTNMMGTDCNLTIGDSSGLPAAGLGTTSMSSGTPIAFTAPEEGCYEFTVDSAQSPLQYLDETGNWVYAGSGFSITMQEDEQIWLFSSFNPTMSVNLTIEKSTLITSVYTCPASLTEIHEEAFAGVDVQKVILTDQILRIDARAFADCASLQLVLIPIASVEIAPDAFENCSNVTIIAPSGGSVEQYATVYGIPFQDINA